jgi:hypothetical protein
MVSHHEVDLGHALGQVDRISEIVSLGEGTDGLQQFGRGGLGERGGREHADPSLALAVPGGEQVIDALQAFVSQFRRRRALHSARPSGDIGPATFSLSRIDSAKTQRRPVCASAVAWRAMPPEFSTMVVVPVFSASSAPMVTISVPSSP